MTYDERSLFINELRIRRSVVSTIPKVKKKTIKIDEPSVLLPEELELFNKILKKIK